MGLIFSSSGKNYTATVNDIFMDNGATVIFIEKGKFASPHAERVRLSDREWRRIKPGLVPVDYEQYYGKKPLVGGVNIYKLKTGG